MNYPDFGWEFARKEKQKMSTIAIAIAEPPLEGDSITNWEIWETNAPKDYDGFGTFTVCEYDGVRTVLIRCEHWDWQTARYSSGNHLHKQSPFEARDVARALWDRVLKRNGQ